MTDDAIRKLIAELEWTFAKTYAKKSPHEYAVCKAGSPHHNDAVQFMKHIFKHGETELYYDHPFRVYRIDGRKYWTMAKAFDDITDDDYLINRSMTYNVDTIYG